MSHADFVHLRVHTAFSLSQGAIHIARLAALCAEQAMPAVAITDSNNLFGGLEFSLTMAEHGVQPIIGCCLGVVIDGAEPGRRRSPVPPVMVLLAQDRTGYGNLLKLVSHAHLDSAGHDQPHVGLDLLGRHAAGLIALTGGPAGPVGIALQGGRPDEARAIMEQLAALFEGRLYVEIGRHGMAAEQATEPAFLALADDFDLPLVATNDVHFVDEGMYRAHDALLCIADGTYVNQRDRRRLTPEHWFKSAAEMRHQFADLPEAIDNTLVIAQRCAVAARIHAPILPTYPLAPGEDEAAHLRQLATEGLKTRLRSAPPADIEDRDQAEKPYFERLERELEIITRMDYPGYFLIVADFIRWAKTHGVPVGPGRGSGAGSVVAWALTITDLDPLRFGLLFERFLNPERVSMPDFDIDFCQDKRDRVIRYVQDKYGADRVAQIITFGKLKARAVLRDVGRVLEMPHGQVDRLCKMVPNNPAKPLSLSEAFDVEPRLRHERDSDQTVAHMIEIALRLEGLYRHASTHAAGVVIGDRPLDELVPLYRDPRSEIPVTQFDMKWVEKAGLVKFDFLGLKTLTVIDRACGLIRGGGGEVDIATLALDDKPTFELLGRGDSVGVFQLEGSGMRETLRNMKPDAFTDIIALVALYRPGPMDNIPTYIRRKHGKEAADYLHPSLSGILQETHGVIIYQEQVMQIAQVLAGYSLGEADLLRRAMGKKNVAEMDAQRERFVSGALANGVDERGATVIFELVAKFAGYGFNKSHAAAYALVAYQTAWLKTHYPVQFMAASMTLDMTNTDKLAGFKAELDRLGIAVLPPDVNRSCDEFTVETMPDGSLAVRYALAAIKNVGRHAIERLVATREDGGLYTDIFDFADRIDPRAINKRLLESLIKAGALDGLSANRAQLFGAAEMLLRQANLAARDRESRQVSMFDGDAAAVVERPPLPPTTDWPAIDKLERESEAIGFYLTGHPLDDYAEALAAKGVTLSSRLKERAAAGTTHFKLAGVIRKIQERTSAKGNRFAFVTLSDAGGGFEVTVFSETLSQNRELLSANQAVLLSVNANLADDMLKLTVQSLRSLDRVVEDATAGLTIFLAEAAPLAGIQEVLGNCPGKKGAVTLVLTTGEGEIEMTLPGRHAISPRARAAVAAVPGVIEARQQPSGHGQPGS